MTNQRDEFYQPWARETPPPAGVAPVKRRYEPDASPPGALAQEDAMPLGVDVSGYVLDEAAPPKPLPERVKPLAQAAGQTSARLWVASGQAARDFADWTIRLGARADVPTRVAALEIPRRSAVVAQRCGALLAAGGRAAATMVQRGSATTARAAGQMGRSAKSGIGDALASGKAASERQFARLRPEADSSTAPESGLDRLLQSEPGTSDRAVETLPLFTAAPSVAIAPQPAMAQQSSSVTPTPPPPADQSRAAAATPPPAGAIFGGGRNDLPGGFGGLRPWWPLVAAMLVLMALSFWLGSRWGGGMTRGDVESIVRDTILANPEIVPQALEKHQANQMATAIDGVRPVLEKPFSGAWVGNARGDVTLTVFTDYGCVFCRASVPDVDRLVREDKGVKVVFRELPIIAPQSKDAAIAALAAARQGKYDAFHHAMFAAPSLDRAAVEAASTRAGVILDGRSDANADTRLFEREIDNNLALAQQLGVNATPTWIIGKRILQGAVGYPELKKAVADAREAN